jgi:hypothetical protein
MTYVEVFEGFKSLNAADKQRLMQAARQLLKFSNSNLAYGAKVQFKHSKTGAVITGTFVKMKQKYAEVMSYQDQYGRKGEYGIRWSVSPDILMPLPAGHPEV